MPGKEESERELSIFRRETTAKEELSIVTSKKITC